MMVVAAALLMVALAVGTVAATGKLWRSPAHPTIGINNVYNIGNDYGLDAAPSSILRVWMETGSAVRSASSRWARRTTRRPSAGSTAPRETSPSRTAAARWGVAVTLMLDGPLVDVDGDPSWYSLQRLSGGGTVLPRSDPLR